ncbi:MAG: hypothetical protein PHD97_10950, partial [Bacteroidales bacterium]|nr:hypothetical protein [Bacteroidales bacterium]
HRILINLLKNRRFEIDTTAEKKFLIIGEKEEAERVAGLLKQTFITPSFIGFVKPKNSNGNGNGFYIGTLEQIKEILEIYKIDEVIFCAKDLTSNQIIDVMTIISAHNVDYKIAPPESLFIIGSNSINTTGELYVININSITKIENKRNKRILDVVSSLIMLMFFPFLIFVVRKRLKFIKNIFLVFVGCKAWVGYNDNELQILHQNIYSAKLPVIRKGILNCTDALTHKNLPQETINRLNILYARDYKLANDIVVILKNIRNLGR